MNKERLLRVAQAIESHEFDLGFNMSWWNTGIYSETQRAEMEKDHGSMEDKSGHNCGTVACIGGWTEKLYPAGDAWATLDLTHEERKALFYGNDGEVNLKKVTQEQAVRVLRHAAETGIIDWSINP